MLNGGIKMDNLVRIKSIDNFRFFNAYRWDNHLKPFGKFNLIYGWNGCGKSTLGDFFYTIESEGSLPPDCTFQLCFQSVGNPENIVTKRTVSTIAHHFKVYHQGYVYGLISHPDNIKHISIIGHSAGETVERINALNEQLEAQKSELNALKNDTTAISRDFETYRRERAGLVRSITGYSQSYNYNKIYERYKQIGDAFALSIDEYNRLTLSVKATPKTRINALSISHLTRSICDKVRDVLSESPVFSVIQELQENSKLRNWVQVGYEIHKCEQKHICEFCHSPIPQKRWDDLENYFNDSLTQFKQHIKSVLEQLKYVRNQYDEYRIKLPHETQFFDEFSSEYCELKEKADRLCESYINFIDAAIKIVEQKNDKIIGSEFSDDFSALLQKIDFDHSIFDEINALIAKHNEKADDFRRIIDRDKEKLELHVIAQSSEKFKDYERRLDENSAREKDIIGKIGEVNGVIEELDAKIRNSRIPAEIINSDINFLLGNSDLHFEWKENGYEIKRNDKIATYLSTGEQNAIALIYFFNSLQDHNNSKENCILILDDPISSFDSNHYYSAAAYIRDKLQSIGQAFIFTHKFSLYKDFCRMLPECHRYLLEREHNNPVLKEEDTFLRDYQDEYVYLFHKIYHFVKNPPKDIYDYLPYPNMGRRLLEGFTAFKLPGNKDILAKAIELDGSDNTARVRAITRLIQNQSHLRLVGVHDGADNILDIRQLPNIFQHLLNFIKDHDPMHYKALVSQVDPESMEESIDTPVVERTIPLFDLPVSAGFGNIIDTYEPSVPYKTTNAKADFALKISGNSMEPLYFSGDIILVKRQQIIDNAEIGIVTLNDEVFCKKIITTGDSPLLVSLNRKYPPRKVLEGERFEVLGVVLEKA